MTRVLSLAAVVLIGAAGAARAQEEDVPLDKVPKVVMDAFKKRFPRAEPTGAAKEVVDKKTFYEVTFKEKGKNVDVTLTAEGELTMIEKEIDAKDLPKAVTEAVEAKYPKATYKIAEELVTVKDGKETLDAYEVLIETADKKAKWELKLDKAGKILETEDKTNEKEEKKK